MKSLNLPTLATATFLTLLLCGQPPLARAGGEGFSKDDLGGKDTIDSKASEELGVGKFKAFPFHVTVSARAGYDDNVNQSSFDTQESWFTNLSALITYNFGSPRTKISLSAGAGVTYYFDQRDDGAFGSGADRDYDVNAFVAFAITHRASARLTLAANIYASYQSQPSFDTFAQGGLGFTRTDQNYFYSTNKFSVGYAWAPRFTTVTSYALTVVNYDSEVLSTFEDRYEHTFGNEFRFLLTPTTTLVGEYRLGIVDYTETENRGSISHFFLAGVDHSFSPRFNISARGGIEVREFDTDVPEGDEVSPYAELTVNYAIAQGTSLAWTNRYSLEEPDVPDAFSRTTFRTALSVRHNLTQRIVAGLNVAYEHDNNHSAPNFPGFDEDSFDISLSVRYAISRTWAIDAGYQHTEVISDEALFREYSRNRYYAGVTFSF